MAARHAEHRRAAVLVILALLTILSVSWRLHQVGIAMTDDEYSCGYEEHVHSDACYTEVLMKTEHRKPLLIQRRKTARPRRQLTPIPQTATKGC